MQTRLLKPGILLALKSKVVGGVVYERRDLPPETLAEAEERILSGKEKASVARWETTRIILDPEDYERAGKARSDARNIIARVCNRSDFGLLCPESREGELNEAVAGARKVTDAHNRSSSRTSVSIYVLKGRVAATDEEAVRSITAEVRELVETMQAGFDFGVGTAADIEKAIKAARDAATSAKQLAGMLDGEAARTVSAAIEECRNLAREVVKRAKDGESFAKIAERVQLDALRSERFAFLDTSAPIDASDIERPTTRFIEAVVLGTEQPDLGNVLAFEGAFSRRRALEG